MPRKTRRRPKAGKRTPTGFSSPSLCVTHYLPVPCAVHRLISHWHGLVYFLLQSVATLISVAIQGIQPNPQDTPSNFYLANIYQTISDPNQPNVSSSLPTSPPTLPPPNYAIWVNSLWFLSLMVSLTCALLATLLQQWVQRYLRVTQPRYSLHKRAQIRSFFAEGVDESLLPCVV